MPNVRHAHRAASIARLTPRRWVAPQVLRYNRSEDVGRELLRPRWGGCRHCLGSFIRDEPLLRNGCQILHRIVEIEPRESKKNTVIITGRT